MSEEKLTTFLNVDVELRSKSSLKELGTYLSKSVFMLSNDEFFIAFEARFDPGTLDDLIRRLVQIVHALPPRLRTIWDQCESRRFDLGIEAGLHPPVKTGDMSSETIELLAGVQAEMRITIYSAKADN